MSLWRRLARARGRPPNYYDESERSRSTPDLTNVIDDLDSLTTEVARVIEHYITHLQLPLYATVTDDDMVRALTETDERFNAKHAIELKRLIEYASESG